jgi:4-aminobutyrate aminotransferase-like enzyme
MLSGRKILACLAAKIKGNRAVRAYRQAFHPLGTAMTHILHRSLRHLPPVAVGGDGIHLRDNQGRSYIDASGGAAVSSLGHGHPDIIAAMHRQIDRCA